jgi:cytochrome c-type biogenesis protein
MEELKLLAAGIGLGWGPCLMFWGPLLLPYIAAMKRTWLAGLKISLMFSIGRLLALALLGGLASEAFQTLNRFFPPHRSFYLHIAIAFLIIFMGILVFLGRGFKAPLYQVLRRHMLVGTEYILLLGFLIGVSPCAPLIAILTYIAYTATNLLQGIIYALFFGMGTVVPVMTLGALTGLFSEKIFRFSMHVKILRILCGIIIILFGIYLFYNVWILL